MRILWIKTEFLHPVDKGGRIRTYQMLREIAKSHHVTYLTLDDGTAAPDAMTLASEYSAEVVRIPYTPAPKGSIGFYGELLGNVVSSLPYAVSRYRSPAMADAIREHVGAADLLVCDFLTPAVNVPRGLGVPTVLFQHNVEAMIWERHAAVARSTVRKQYMKEQWRRMVRFERDECHRFDHVVAVSPQDADVMRAQYGVDNVSHVPTGVDIEYFTPTGREDRHPRELVFTGSMDWMPNDDAMIWFAEDILPLVRSSVPDLRVTIVGRSPSQRLTNLAGATGMEVTGRVPDVRPYLERASAFIVPMRVGGGTRLKIYEAMAMGLPVVSTSIGAEGLPVSDGVTALLRDSPRAFADALVSVLQDDALRSRIGTDGQQLVREKYGWAGVADAFMRSCTSVTNASPSFSTSLQGA